MASCVLEAIEARLEATARRNNCSKSWVVAVALADFLGVANVPRYNPHEEQLRARREGTTPVLSMDKHKQKKKTPHAKAS